MWNKPSPEGTVDLRRYSSPRSLGDNFRYSFFIVLLYTHNWSLRWQKSHWLCCCFSPQNKEGRGKTKLNCTYWRSLDMEVACSAAFCTRGWFLISWLGLYNCLLVVLSRTLLRHAAVMLPQPIFGIRCKILCTSSSLCSISTITISLCLLACFADLAGWLAALPQSSITPPPGRHSLTSFTILSLKLNIDKNRIILTESECSFFLLRLLLLLLLLSRTS